MPTYVAKLITSAGHPLVTDLGKAGDATLKDDVLRHIRRKVPALQADGTVDADAPPESVVAITGSVAQRVSTDLLDTVGTTYPVVFEEKKGGRRRKTKKASRRRRTTRRR
jgi:hypothetical protein